MNYDNLQKISSRLSDIYSNNPNIVKASKMLNQQFLSALDQKTLQEMSDIGKKAQTVISDTTSISGEALTFLDSLMEPIRQSLKQSDFSKAGLELLRACQAPHLETEEPLFEIGEDYVDISESLAEAACDVDDSLSLPKPSANNMIRVFKANFKVYLPIISIIISILLAIYSAHSDDTFKNEVLEYLQQIEENTATDQSPE